MYVYVYVYVYITLAIRPLQQLVPLNIWKYSQQKGYNFFGP